MKVILGLIIGFLIGAGCRWFDVPVPSPPQLLGALLVVAMTTGYLVADKWLTTTKADMTAEATKAAPVKPE